MRGHRSPSYHLFYFSVNLEYAKYKVCGEDIMVIDFFFLFRCLYQREVEKEPQEMDSCPGLWFS